MEDIENLKKLRALAQEALKSNAEVVRIVDKILFAGQHDAYPRVSPELLDRLWDCYPGEKPKPVSTWLIT